MPKLAKELSALEVKRLKHPGDREAPVRIAVGGVSGLHLQITPGGGRSWVLRLSVGGKRRELGLGSYPEVGLADAHSLAREAKAKSRQGIDPVREREEARQAAMADERRELTFSDAVDGYMKLNRSKSAKNRSVVYNRLRNYTKEISGKRVGDIDKHAIKRVLEPIWETKVETASRLRYDMERVFNWATGNDHMIGPNPAAWKGNLEYMLPEQPKASKNHPAVAVEDAPRWMAELRKREGVKYRALEFIALTASRSQEGRGATWGEIDLDRGIWTVPDERMKTRVEHRVPLPAAAIDLLQALPRDGELVFPPSRASQINDAAISETMRNLHEDVIAKGGAGFFDAKTGARAVAHGLRSTFKDWATEAGIDDIQSELALSHTVGSAVAKAYRRTDLVERRRAMMDAWAAHLDGDTAENVVRLHHG